MTQLPGAKALFDKYFLIEYGPRDKARLGKEYPSAEVYGAEAWVGKRASDISAVTIESQADIKEIVQSLLDHAQVTWEQAFGEPDAHSLKGVAAFEQAHPPEVIAQIIERSDPLNANNDYIITASLLGAVLGAAAVQACPRLQWVYDHPLWECSLFDPATGMKVPVFHWAIHRMSGDGQNEDLAGRMVTGLDFLNRIVAGTAQAREIAADKPPKR